MEAKDYLKDYVSYPIKINEANECVMYNEQSVLAMIKQAYKDGVNEGVSSMCDQILNSVSDLQGASIYL